MAKLANDDFRDRHIDGIADEPTTVELSEDPVGDITELPDGSAIISEPEEEQVEATEFNDNLAELLSNSEETALAGDLIDLITKDKKAREKRDEQYAEGIRRTGLGDEAPGGADFHGASKVVHPMMAEACVDFEARSIKELFPASGPVRTSISGDETEAKLQLAEKKRDILNWQLTKGIPEYRDELESLLSQLPLGGSAYQKMWPGAAGRKHTEFIPVDHMILPYAATNFYTSPRATHWQFITKSTFERRIHDGLYRDIIDPEDSVPSIEDSQAGVASNKVEGRDDSEAYNEDGLREIYEITISDQRFDFDDITGGDPAPYIIHLDVYTERILGIYRNWEPDDELRQKLDWVVEWGFIPWRGAYKLGLPQLIGSLSGAATGTLRALLDSALISNAPTLLKLKAGRLTGQTTEVALTQVQEIEGPAGIDDIRKLVTPIPFAGPNPVLFQLLGFLVDAGKGVVATAEEKIADAGNNMPVGTSLALIEQGSKVYSSIHARLHASQAKTLEILCRLNKSYPDVEAWTKQFGQVDPNIFAITDDIAPVSDPNVFSEAQRMSQMQAVMQLMGDQSVQYNRIEAHRRMLRLLNISDIDRLLPDKPQPKKVDAVQENTFAVSGLPLKAYPDQNHLAHIETHLRFILSPIFGAGPAYMGPQLAPILAHCGEHLTMLYPTVVANGQAQALVSGRMLPDANPDVAQASGSAIALQDQQTLQHFQTLMQMYGQAQQLVQSKMPPPPMDPSAQVTMQVAKMEDARLQKKDQADIQLRQGELQRNAQKDQAEFALKQQDQQFRQQLEAVTAQQAGTLEQMKQVLTQRIAEMSDQVELMKNDADNKQHQMTELLKNRDDNQTQIILEQLKNELSTWQKSNAEAAAATQPSGPDFAPQIKEMQDLLGRIEAAKTSDALGSVMQGLQAAISSLHAPKVIVRDQNGRAIGVQTVSGEQQ